MITHSKSSFLLSLVLIAALLFKVTALADNTRRITDYHQTFFPCYKIVDSALRIAIRQYYMNNIPYYLVVDPFTFTTEASPAANYRPRKKLNDAPGYFNRHDLMQTPYMKALTRYSSPPYKLENYGITQAEHAVNGVFLTTDMCPSSKPFEAEYFKALVKLSDKIGEPLPIALSITGMWIIGHPEEFKWLMKQEKQNKLKITWINHSYSHVYYHDVPLTENFLLIPQTNITHEILATEKLLLEHNELPSVFFRFPGLISNKILSLRLWNYGLIPIGSDAWLAKNQDVKPGSFILVHGNSNEPEGIKKIMPILQNYNYKWLPLNVAFDR